MKAQVRTARTDDIDEIIALWEVAAENAARPVDSRAGVLRLLERDPDALLLAELDGVIVGTVIAGWDGWRAHLYRLAVHPARRGDGIARTLVDAAERRLHVLGAQRFDAMVLDDNTLGTAFWSARGYSPQAEWRRWVRPAETAPRS
ncbi:GNAT family N-acetyltransferase [Aeromicrobium phragmitis]|uniref:GNAT family N-acetyltransferase n=1 Tax=Aeromicrobium phragmitis TaxID=2478914 RepID=A0A3L8PJ94_9ACTN|nr:GNAT family N-acetyltransferase [Aeromicrobium phragmitis]RLV54753.1 GNAT family N-acetyltransferase [Aeromicrobium phragmitis]